MTTPTQGEHAQTEALFYASALENCAEVDFDRIFVPAAAVIRRLHAQVTALTAALGVQADPVKDEATCQMCGEKPYPGCNSEFQDEAACRFYHPVTAQTALAHELFAAAQLAPGEGIEDAVSRIAAALTAAQEVPKCEFLAHGCDTPSYCQSVQRCTARDEKRTTTAQPAAPQGVAYAGPPAECDSPELCAVSRSCAGQFGTKRICASNGQAPAGAADDDEVDLPDAEDMAHSALQEALSFGLSHDVIYRWMRAIQDQTVKVMRTPTAQAAPAAGAVAGSSLIMQVGTQGFDLASTSAHFTAADMYTASAQAFREGQAAAPTPADQADSQPSLTPETASAMVEGMDMNDRVLAAIDAETRADSVLEDAARGALFTTPYQRGEIAGDGKPCNNDHDPDCRWPSCICRHREARFDAARKQGANHD